MNKLPDDLVPVGKFIKPHGIKGQLKFRLFNEESLLLSANSDVWVKAESDNNFKLFKIDSVHYGSLRPIVKLDNINDRDSALDFRGLIIYISRDLFPDNEGNSIYFVDFIGCTVYNLDKRFIGTVQDVAHLPGNNNVIIVRNDENEFLIPIRMDLIKLFDVKKKNIIMDIIDGLVSEVV